MNKNGKILLVDDNPTNIEILEEVLEDFNLSSAVTGEEALNVLPSFNPDLILLDIMMPGINGYEVCKKIRKNLRFRSVKIIMVSAKISVADRLSGYDAGADDYVTKPFQREELLAKVKVYLRLKTLEEVNQLKTDFLRLLCLDTKNPLSSIVKPLATLKKDQNLNDMQKEILERVISTVSNLENLFDRVVSLGAMKTDTYAYNFVKEDFNAIIRESITILEPIAKQKKINIDLKIGRVAYCQMDTMGMINVITALLHNAIRYSSENGQVIVELRDDGVSYKLIVSDGGKGISPDFLPRIFDEFTYVEAGDYVQWHGLSLAMARYIVQKHGGKMDIKSRLGKGATFTISIPMVKHFTI